MQIIGGAFGWGISQNLRELLSFVIQSYQPGSKIFLFGFSRGAFTVRLLADIICRYGIPNKNGLKTAEQVEAVATKMLRSYKHVNRMLWRTHRKNSDDQKSQFIESHPEVRQLRVGNYRSNSNDGVQFGSPEQQASDSNETEHLIHFLGCWDTVEALGVPFEAVKQAAIFYFPLRSQNTIPSPKIKTIRHALSLDDERKTFHPLCFTDHHVPGQDILQTWFPGNHCHVGGGYSRDQMAMAPLEWMIKHACGSGLDINESQFEDYIADKYVHGQLPCARSGMNFFYGYHPRRIDHFQKTGPWSIHVSAFQRLGNQIQTYLPTGMLVENTNIHKDTLGRSPGSHSVNSEVDAPVIYIDGGGVTLELDNSKLDLNIPKQISLGSDDVKDYVSLMSNINETNVWMGRVLWYACFAYFASLPLMGWVLRASEKIPIFEFLKQPLPEASLRGSALQIEEMVLGITRSFLPSIVGDSFIAGLLNRPGLASCWLIGLVVLLFVCKRNRSIVEQKSFEAWLKTPADVFKRHGCEPDGPASTESPRLDQPESNKRIGDQRPSWLKRCTQLINQILSWLASVIAPRAKPFLDGLFAWTKKLFASIFGVYAISTTIAVATIGLFLVAALFQLGHQWNYNSVTRSGKNLPALKSKTLVECDGIFDTKKVAFNTGFLLQKGVKYEVRLKTKYGGQKESDFGWSDGDETNKWWIGRCYPANPNGFDEPELAKNWIFGFRKYPDKPMFKVLGKTEPNGSECYEIGIGDGKTFTADEDGVLVLFVNDAKGFYWNNAGKAKVFVRAVE